MSRIAALCAGDDGGENPPMARLALRPALAGSILLAVLYGLASLDWRPDRVGEVMEPRHWRAIEDGPGDRGLLAGAAAVDVTPERPMPLGGFSARWGRVFEGVRDPVQVRALALSSAAGGPPVVVLGLDAALVPSALSDRIRAATRARVPEAQVVVTATHTHAGPGGIWDGRIAALAGMGAYDAAHVDGLVSAAADAAAEAFAARVPVVLAATEGEGPAVCDGHRAGRSADRRLSVLRFAAETGTVARLVVFACHPTFLGHRDRRVSAEWPGEAARHLEGVTLILQGAVGDQRPAGFGRAALGLDATVDVDVSSPEGRMVAAGRAVAAAVRRLEADLGPEAESGAALGLRTVEVALPPATGETAAPRGLRGLAGNVLSREAPEAVRVSLLEIGEGALVFVPAEVVSEVAARWEAGGKQRVVSLADGYLGYLETAEALSMRAGESRHAYFDADAVALVGEAVARLLAAPDAP
jgi:neutral ceramidase